MSIPRLDQLVNRPNKSYLSSLWYVLVTIVHLPEVLIRILGTLSTMLFAMAFVACVLVILASISIAVMIFEFASKIVNGIRGRLDVVRAARLTK